MLIKIGSIHILASQIEAMEEFGPGNYCHYKVRLKSGYSIDITDEEIEQGYPQFLEVFLAWQEYLDNRPLGAPKPSTGNKQEQQAKQAKLMLDKINEINTLIKTSFLKGQ